jgi:hypothetical protein
MQSESFDWEQLKWMVPVAAVVGGILWRVARPACEVLVFFLINGSPRREKTVKEVLAVELEQLDDVCERLARAEAVLAAHADSMSAFEESLLRQGQTLTDQIASVFEPLKETMRQTAHSLREISREMQSQGREISEIRGYMRAPARNQGGTRD